MISKSSPNRFCHAGKRSSSSFAIAEFKLRAKPLSRKKGLVNLPISQEEGGIAGLNEECQRIKEESKKVIKWVPRDKPGNLIDGRS